MAEVRAVISRADMDRLLGAVAQAGGVDALLARRSVRSKTEPVAFRTAGEVLDAKANGVITRAEARKLLAIPTIRSPRKAPG